jgi:hypothetical protein
MYIELKTGYSGNGPAWIGKVEFSKSGQTIYFDNKAIKKLKNPGISANHFDIETGDEYWVSGVKKNGSDRHYGGGRIMVDRKSIQDYLSLVDFAEIDERKFDIIDFAPTDKKRFKEIENTQNEDINSNKANIQSRYWDNNRKKLS